jgi:DNA repair exonuclease SbcCD ATPase subunit
MSPERFVTYVSERSLVIDNIKGIAHTEFAPGSLTVIRGSNGSGKSSILDAVLAVFSGGSDPGWLRKGAQKGSIVLEITDYEGKPVATITKTITRKKSGEGVSCLLEILDQNGVPIAAPQTFVNKLGESWAVDPSAILGDRHK